MEEQRLYYISEDRLLELLQEEAELIALQNGGVDNWDWYDESCQNYLDLCGAEDFDEIAYYRLDEFMKVEF